MILWAFVSNSSVYLSEYYSGLVQDFSLKELEGYFRLNYKVTRYSFTAEKKEKNDHKISKFYCNMNYK